MTIVAISIPSASFTAVAVPPFSPWRGNWNQTTQYLVNDLVFRGVSTWRALAVNLFDDPAAGSPSGNWTLVASGIDPTTLNAAATSASNSASQASTSATNAANSATLAAAQISGAASYANNSAASATASANSAVQAQTASGAVTTSATNAANSASAASTSASNAASSASAASSSASSAAASATTAAGYAAGGLSPSGSFTAGHIVQAANSGTTGIQISDTGIPLSGLPTRSRALFLSLIP